jgi:hypothetical protein
MSFKILVSSLFVFTLLLSSPSKLKAATVQFGGLTFTLTNTQSDGSASVSTDGSTLTIVGPNNGSGLPGTTDLTATIPATGSVDFQWSFSTADDPGFESASYLLNGTLTELADTDRESGSVTIPVKIGDQFGFEADSVDNTFGAGILTVTSFSAPQAIVNSAPEPGSWTLLLIGCAFTLLFAGRRHVCRYLEVKREQA